MTCQSPCRTTWQAVTRSFSHSVFGSGRKIGFPSCFDHFRPSGLVAYPMAFGSYCSPPEYHIRYSFRPASYPTCGHMTATFSHGCSAVRTGFSPARSQVLPSVLVAYPIEDLPSAWPVYHRWYRPPSRITTGRFRSFSQPDVLRGPRTIRGSPQARPSGLSTRAILCFGRQENHMRYRLSSRSTEISKQVPRVPPRTGF